MDINDIIDSIYKLPDASKEALLSDAPEVACLLYTSDAADE